MTIEESVVKSEVLLNDEEKFDPGAADTDSDTEDQVIKEDQFITREGHKKTLTRNVPPEILYTVRGVRCWLCHKPFRNPKAVDMLLDHTKEMHPKKATASFLRLLRRENALTR